MIKLLSISFDHVRLFENEKFELDFFAEDKVPGSDESVFLHKKPVYTNNIIALAGVNASGKTTALKLLSLALQIVNGQIVPYQIAELFSSTTRFHAVLSVNGQVYLIESVLEEDTAYLDEDTMRGVMVFKEEVLYRYDGRIKKAFLGDPALLCKSESCREVMRRSTIEENARAFLGSTTSIMTSFQSRVRTIYFDSSDYPIVLGDGFPGIDEVLQTFDPSIKHLKTLGHDSFDLAFYGNDTHLNLSTAGVEKIMSSGTSRGLELVKRIVSTLRQGGYLLIDEIEMHLNKRLVEVAINLFAAKTTNPYGAVLVFTTHYPELLDCVHRKDNVFFLVRNKCHKVEVIKYSKKVSRIENKKSEVFISNYIDGTAPNYSHVNALRKYIESMVVSDVPRS